MVGGTSGAPPCPASENCGAPPIAKRNVVIDKQIGKYNEGFKFKWEIIKQSIKHIVETVISYKY